MSEGMQKNDLKKQWIAATFVAVFAPAYAQLHLVTGSPTPKYNQSFESVLFKVGDDGSVKSIAELVPGDVQTQWITISYDSKIMLIRSNPRIIAVNLDKAAIVKDCAQPATPPGLRSIVGQWLLEPPSGGTALALAYFDGSGVAMWEMMMDPLIPCSKSFLPLGASELRSVVIHGYSGVADVGSSDIMGVFPDATGRIKIRWPGAGETDFGCNAPAGMLAHDPPSETAVVINNSELLSLLNTPDRTRKQRQRTLVLRKSDKTWHRVSVPTERFDWQRGFGKYIAITEAHAKSTASPESAGRAEWRNTVAKMGPSVSTRLDDANVVFSGRLYLYDIDTERVYTISTNQGDSEVLLVENNVAYYRASDRLYSVPITEKGLGTAQLLATDEAVRDAHWAFIKH